MTRWIRVGNDACMLQQNKLVKVRERVNIVKTCWQGDNLIVWQVQSCASRFRRLWVIKTLMRELRDKIIINVVTLLWPVIHSVLKDWYRFHFRPFFISLRRKLRFFMSPYKQSGCAIAIKQTFLWHFYLRHYCLYN